MIGIHLKKRQHATYEDALTAMTGAYGAKAFQIFLTNPRSITAVKMNHARLTEAIAQQDLHMYVHASYICRPWGKLDSVAASLKSLRDDVAQCAQMGGRGVVVHLPAKVSNIADSLSRLAPTDNILLEPIATKAADNYSSPKILAQLPHKICVDTAHLWSMGVNMRRQKVVIDWFAEMGDRVGLIHLNGSFVLIGSGKDKHAVPFSKDDRIWGKTKYAGSSCEYIVNYARARNIDMIIENNIDTDAADASIAAFIAATQAPELAPDT